MLLKNSAGSQIDIMPTLLDLVAPKGFSYHTIGRSLFKDATAGVNYRFFITRTAIGEADQRPLEAQPIEGTLGTIDQDELAHTIDAIRALSYWLSKYGTKLDDSLRAKEAGEE